MKTYFTRILIAVCFLLSLTAFAESPASSQADTDRVGRPSLQAGPDGFPENFPLTDDAIVSYYNDTIVRGYSSVYGPAVLEPTTGKSSASASATDGGDAILQRLLAQPLSFRIANPKDNYVVLQANLQNADGQTIFYGARGYRPEASMKGGPGWYIPMDAEGVQLFLSERLPGLKIPNVNAIHIIPKKSDGGWSGEDYWVQSNCDEKGCAFNFDLKRLPLHGQVILVRYEKAGAIEKSYDIGTGVPSEVSVHSAVFNGGINGMKSFSDWGMEPDRYIQAIVTVQRWEQSPLVVVNIENVGQSLTRAVNVAAKMVDENGNLVARAINVRWRASEDSEWSRPVPMSKVTGAYSVGWRVGKYYFIFGWPDGTFPEPNPIDPGDGKGSTEPAVY